MDRRKESGDDSSARGRERSRFPAFEEPFLLSPVPDLTRLANLLAKFFLLRLIFAHHVTGYDSASIGGVIPAYVAEIVMSEAFIQETHKLQLQVLRVQGHLSLRREDYYPLAERAMARKKDTSSVDSLASLPALDCCRTYFPNTFFFGSCKGFLSDGPTFARAIFCRLFLVKGWNGAGRETKERWMWSY
jgi:hypothetical protein